MKPPALPVEKFEAIYQEWEEKNDLEGDVQRHLAERSCYLQMLDRALAGLPPGARALELGCGTGIDSCLLARRHPHICFFGVDIAEGSLALVRRMSAKTGQRILLVRGDVFRLPFRSGTFSLIFHQGLVEHFPNPQGTMGEQERLLAPGGWAVVSAPQTLTGYTLMKRLRIWAGTWPWGWERSYSAAALEALGRKTGLLPVERRGEGYWRSWGEPAWVLRDLSGKLHRRNPLRTREPFAFTHWLWEGLWGRMEEAFGHRFCKNVIVSFRKPVRRGGA